MFGAKFFRCLRALYTSSAWLGLAFPQWGLETGLSFGRGLVSRALTWFVTEFVFSTVNGGCTGLFRFAVGLVLRLLYLLWISFALLTLLLSPSGWDQFKGSPLVLSLQAQTNLEFGRSVRCVLLVMFNLASSFRLSSLLLLSVAGSACQPCLTVGAGK